MESFSTYLFEKNLKKTIRYWAFNPLTIGLILLIVLSYFFGWRVLGLGLIGIIWRLIRISKEEDEFMGITAHGKRGKMLTITATHFQIGDAILPFSELTDLMIYLEEYKGQPRDLLGVHHGGNNEITFKYKDQPMSFYYIINSKADFLKLEKLVEKIE